MAHILEHSVLAVATTIDILSALESIGHVEEWRPGATIFERHADPGDLFVILEGVVFIRDSERDPNELVIGPGNIFGEIGFFLGTKRTKEAMVGPDGCRMWRVGRDVLNGPKDAETLILLTHLMVCLGSLVATRLHSLALKNSMYGDQGEREVTFHCDHDHVALRRLAEHLEVEEEDPDLRDWKRAASVWNYVRKIPYRFGKWHVRASVSIPMNGGDHYSKTNLQVALLRALGLRAGYVKARVRHDFFQMLQYQDSRLKAPRIAPRNLAEYCFCAVWLDGGWVHCDASFPREVIKVLSEHVPEMGRLVGDRLAPHQPYSLLQALGGVVEQVDEVLKATVYQDDSLEVVEARNILLDRVQSYPFQVPEWVRAVSRLLARDPEEAFLRAFGSLVYDLKRFHQMICIKLGDEF